MQTKPGKNRSERQRRLAVALVLALVLNLSSPLLSEMIGKSTKIAVGQVDIVENTDGEFLYQTKSNKFFTAKFGDKANKFRHRVRLEQENHAFELSFLPPSNSQFPPSKSPSHLRQGDDGLTGHLVGAPPTPTLTHPTITAVSLASASASLSTPAAELVKGLHTQLEDISKHLSTVSAEIEKIQQDSAKISKEVKQIAGGTKLSFEEDKILVKNNDVIPGVDIAYRAATAGIKESIIINDKERFVKPDGQSQLSFDFSLELTNLIPNRDEHGNWRFRSKEDNSDVFTIFSPTIKDSNGATASAQIELANPNGTTADSTEFKTSIIVPKRWLIDEKRVYPVTLKHLIKANRENIEHNPRTTLSRKIPVNTTIKKPSSEDFLGEVDYSWQVKLPTVHSGMFFHRFTHKDHPGQVKVVNRDGWFLSFKLNDGGVQDENLVGNQIMWRSAQGIISRYLSLPNKLKADYVIEKREALSGNSHNQLDFMMQFNDQPADENDELTVFRGKGFLRPEQNDDGTISFIAENGQEIFKLPLPRIIDANGNEVIGKFTLVKTAQGTARLSVKVPVEFLDTATFPITIDPTVLDSDITANALNPGYGKSIIRTTNGKLVACWADNGVNRTVCRASSDDGATWGSEAQISSRTPASDRPAIYFDQTDGDTFHLAKRETVGGLDTAIYYYKGTLSGTTISFSSGLIIENTNIAWNPSIITDTENNRPAVAWRFNTLAGQKKAGVRFLRCDAGATDCDTAITNWCNAAGTSCGTAGVDKSDPGSADQMGSYTSAHTSHIATLNQMPDGGSCSNNECDLYIWWIIDDTDTLYYQYASWDGVDDWTWQGEATEDSTISTQTGAVNVLASVRDETNNKIYVSYLDETGTNDDIVVFERNSSNTKTGRGSPHTETRGSYSGVTPMAVDSGTIYAFYNPGADTSNYQIAFKINSSGTSWSAEQIFDAGSSGTELNVHQNMPPKVTNNRVDLLWRTGSDPYAAEFGSWHTTETRAVSSETSLPTDDSITLTGADDFFFDEQDYDDSESKNNVYDSGASADGVSDYLVYYFKDTNTNSTDNITPEWEGQFSQACSATTAYLQIYNRGGGSCTAGWETLDSSTTCSANTDFTLSGTQSTNLSCYYGTDTYIGSNAVALRVYKQSSSTAVSGKTDYFSQNATLFTSGGATPTPTPALEDLMRHGRWFDSAGEEQPFTF